MKQTIKILDKRGWIIARQTEDGWKISLTKKGRAELLAYELGQKGIVKPKKWDEKWRLLIFDIPEKRRMVRDKIRRFLQSVGFVRLQDSVWVHPYECREILNMLRTRYGIHAEALYVRVDSLDGDRWLKRHYGLRNI